MKPLVSSAPPVNGPPRKRFRGQGIVEFALILPVMLLVLFLIIELGRLLHAWLAVENGARFGVRYAVTGEYDDAYCVDSDASGTACDSRSEVDDARIPSTEDAARAGSVGILRNETVPEGTEGYYRVTVCSTRSTGIPPAALFTYVEPDPPNARSADCTDAATGLHREDAGGPGDRVRVTVDFDHPLIVPILSVWWPQLHLTASREGIVEQFRTARVVGLPATLALPSFTPTPTLPFTDTPEPTDTPTPTDTPSPTPTDTPTDTPTPSMTPTMTPTPDCSDIVRTNIWISGDDVFMSVQNNNPVAVHLTYTHFDWDKPYGSMYVNEFRFLGGAYYGGNDSNPPTDIDSSGSPPTLGSGASTNWQSDFNNVDAGLGLDGTYSVTLTFDGRCTVSGSVSRNAPTATPSLTPTRTSTVTRTPTITLTPTRTRTPTITLTPTITRTPTVTRTRTITPTRTRTPTQTRTRTATTVPSITNTQPPSPTRTITPTRTRTPVPPTSTTGPTQPPTTTRTRTPTATSVCVDC